MGRFRGLRLVHTHLRGEPLSKDDLNDLALLRLDLVAMIEALPDGLPGRVEVAHLSPGAASGAVSGAAGDGNGTTDENGIFERLGAPDVHRLELDVEATMRALEEELARLAPAAGATARERALLIGLHPDDEHLVELRELVRAAGVEVAGEVRQRRAQVHPKTVVGRGKLQEIVLEGMRRRATVAIFDLDLKPAQARAFEDATGLKAIDRTQLILDIFAQRAKSRDGKLQVELAQLRYDLPRLTDRDAGLSRLAGGIGGRGPGETVMEIGRRRIRDRIRALESQVAGLSRQRDLRRRRRRERDLPVLSIVGYTNAGKSTLLNALTASAVDVADLPRDLIAAFRATLEELSDADLLLHVVDVADPRLEAKVEAVVRLLDELGLARIERLMVLNKADRVAPSEAAAWARRFGGVAVSAVTREGLAELVHAAEERLGRARPLLANVSF